ncbi:MAG: LPD28 domain-containing protein [Patescibacteria group bacterium]
MIKACINGINCILFYDERIAPEKAPQGYPYMYHIRHDENNWTRPVNLERFVVVNFFGTVFMKEPIEIDASDYLEINSFEMEGNYVVFEINEKLSGKLLSL